MHSVTTISLKPSLASNARRALQALAATLSGAYAGWMHYRQVRATGHALGLLDDHTLHDLALGRSELLSAATELHGHGRRERRQAGPATHLPR